MGEIPEAPRSNLTSIVVNKVRQITTDGPLQKPVKYHVNYRNLMVKICKRADTVIKYPTWRKVSPRFTNNLSIRKILLCLGMNAVVNNQQTLLRTYLPFLPLMSLFIPTSPLPLWHWCWCEKDMNSFKLLLTYLSRWNFYSWSSPNKHSKEPISFN